MRIPSLGGEPRTRGSTSMIVTLYSGHIEGPTPTEGTAPAVLDRPVMLVYEGDFASMDGPVTITAGHLEELAKNHNARLDKLSLASGGEPAMKDLPPIQLDHTTSAANTVGRVIGPLRVAAVTIDGKERRALLGTARFLGRENVEKASDGRWTNVSIGADLESGVLKELSVTPFPAAPKAALLTKGAKMPMPEEMKKRFKKHLARYKKMSDEDAEKHMASLSDDDAKKLAEEVDKKEQLAKRCKKHLTEQKKMSEEDADKHMAALSEDDEKKLAEEADEEEKKKNLAEPHPEPDGDEKKKELAAARDRVVQLKAEALAITRTAKLEARKGEVSTRLSQLRAKGLIAPAQEKSLGDLRLAEATDDALALVWKVLELMEPVVPVGQYGSVKVVDLSTLGNAVKQTRLAADEASMNMPFTRAMIAATAKANGIDVPTQLATDQMRPAEQAQPAPESSATIEAQSSALKSMQEQITRMAGVIEKLQAAL